MIVSLTIVRYRKPLIPLALLSMAIHRLLMMMQKSCTFWKLMGSGKNGTFDLHPDWQQWALLAVWNDRKDFDHFYSSSLISKWWQNFTYERWTILCTPFQSHGKWDKQEPFGKTQNPTIDGPVAVLTRATIRFSKMKAFWANVDSVASTMQNAPGYITSFGVGEAPVYRQATFSVWKSIEDVKNFAYRAREHADVIRKTRDGDWYSEELFARFLIVDSFGTINGSDPLKDLLNTEHTLS